MLSSKHTQITCVTHSAQFCSSILWIMGRSSFKDTSFPPPHNLSPPFFPLSFKNNSRLTVNEKEHQKWEVRASNKSVVTLTKGCLFRSITHQWILLILNPQGINTKASSTCNKTIGSRWFFLVLATEQKLYCEPDCAYNAIWQLLETELKSLVHVACMEQDWLVSECKLPLLFHI